MESPSSLQNFNFAKFQFIIKAIDRLSLPEYKGSAFRGGFGCAFRKVVCTLKRMECRECILRGKCIYSYIFETPPPADTRLMKKYPSAPHPFVLCPPLEDERLYEPGEEMKFYLTLIGKSIDYLPYFIYTFEELGRMGLGKSRGQFTLEEVGTTQPGCGLQEETIYSGKEKILRNRLQVVKAEDTESASFPPPTLDLNFLTPLRLKFQEGLVSELKFHIFFRNLLRRISLLSYFHCGKELEVDFRGLIRESEEIQTSDSHLRWYDWERYSSRQGEKMKLGGLRGKITFSGNLKTFWPYLIIGEFIHVGKGSSFGLGKYEILNKG